MFEMTQHKSMKTQQTRKLQTNSLETNQGICYKINEGFADVTNKLHW